MVGCSLPCLGTCSSMGLDIWAPSHTRTLFFCPCAYLYTCPYTCVSLTLFVAYIQRIYRLYLWLRIRLICSVHRASMLGYRLHVVDSWCRGYSLDMQCVVESPAHRSTSRLGHAPSSRTILSSEISRHASLPYAYRYMP